MAIRDEENYGKMISEQLAKYLRDWTTQANMVSVAEKLSNEKGMPKVGYTTLRNVVYRSNTLTKNNSRGVEELMRVAIKNCRETSVGAGEAKEFFISQLDIKEIEVESEQIKP